MKKDSKYMLDIVPGAVIAVFSAWYLSMVPAIPQFIGLGATPLTNHFAPNLWGGIMLFLGLWLVVRGIIKMRRFKAAGGVKEKSESFVAVLADKREVIISFVCLTIYVALMEKVGFAIMTTLYLFAQIMILTPREKWKKNIVPAVITAVVASALLYFIFRMKLNVLLPSGLLYGLGL